MRWKIESSISSEYKCCLCCHVRTGTIFYGIWNVLLHLFALVLLMFVVMNPELATKYHRQYIYPNTPEVGINGSEAAYYTEVGRRWTADDLFLATLITLGSLLMACMMVHGALRGRASYIMPFFSLQVFDFCITCLSVVGYFSYVPDVKRWMILQQDFPFREQLLQLDADVLMLMAILCFVAVLLIKSYMLGMVWSCYKYLQCCERERERSLATSGYPADPEASEMLLPPKYEDAIVMAAEDAAGPSPPAYTER